jgi:hypothetical protein
MTATDLTRNATDFASSFRWAGRIKATYERISIALDARIRRDAPVSPESPQ